MVAEREHEEVRHQVEERELHHGDHHGERHGGGVPRREAELLGEGVHLAVHELMPSLHLVAREAQAAQQRDDPVGELGDGTRQQRHGEDAEQNAHVPAKAEHAEDGERLHIRIAVNEEGQTRGEQDGTPCHQTELVHDEARELRGAGLAHVLPGLGEPVDLGGCGPHHHGRQVAEEDAARLNGDEVADAHRRHRVQPHSDGVGDDTEHQVEEHAQARYEEPGHLHGGERGHELGHLARHHQVDAERGERQHDEDGAAAGALAVVARGLGVHLGLGRRFGMRIGHGASLTVTRCLNLSIVAVAARSRGRRTQSHRRCPEGASAAA